MIGELGNTNLKTNLCHVTALSRTFNFTQVVSPPTIWLAEINILQVRKQHIHGQRRVEERDA